MAARTTLAHARPPTPAERANPVLQLPAAGLLRALDAEPQACLRALLLDLQRDARLRATASWEAHRPPLATYWAAVGVYAGHIARVLRPDARTQRRVSTALPRGPIGQRTAPGSMVTPPQQPTRAERANPILQTPAMHRIRALDPVVRTSLYELLLDLQRDARMRATISWEAHKPPMAAYWAAVSVCAGHIACVLRRDIEPRCQRRPDLIRKAA